MNKQDFHHVRDSYNDECTTLKKTDLILKFQHHYFQLKPLKQLRS